MYIIETTSQNETIAKTKSYKRAFAIAKKASEGLTNFNGAYISVSITKDNETIAEYNNGKLIYDLS